MKRLLFVVVACAWAVSAIAQPPANYYNAANGLTGDQLKVALHNIIKVHTSISYSQIWNAFWSTDNKGNGVVWDMYSDRPNGTPPYTYALGQDQCGSYNSEGDCYNREHSWPQSWFNEQSTPRTDMHHIFATDGYVNNRRSNYPFGEVGAASWTSQNGSKLGSCKTPGYSGTVFEPIDAYKGDFARAIMYMSVRYYGEDSGWGSSDMTSKSVIKPWAIALLLRWNKQDPVSQKEIDRNNAIYNDYQHNRNPFVDHPEYADMIWDPSWTLEENQEQAHADGMVVYDLTGRKLFQSNINNEEEAIASMKSKLKQGCYMLLLLDGNRVVTRRKLLVN
ncbi:MAG: endonuclease [Bacteroidales bacterium]|nr:endonuclease [Bacteroidales bacterium]